MHRGKQMTPYLACERSIFNKIFSAKVTVIIYLKNLCRGEHVRTYISGSTLDLVSCPRPLFSGIGSGNIVYTELCSSGMQ